MRLAGVLQFAGRQVFGILEGAVQFPQRVCGTVRLQMRFAKGKVRLLEQVMIEA
jgi:hypothetical protein